MDVLCSVRPCPCMAPWSSPSTSGRPQSERPLKMLGTAAWGPVRGDLGRDADRRHLALGLCGGATAGHGLQENSWDGNHVFLKEKRGQRQRVVAQGITIDRSLHAAEQNSGEDDDGVCPLNCVKEIFSQDDLRHHLEEAGPNSLVVVDFFRTACGSCKYIEKGFMKLCKGESEDEEEGGQHHVVFLKHNVMNEYDEQSDIAEDLRIKVVPLFHFYKDGKLVESFATRDKNRLLATIYKYTNRESEIEKLEHA